MSWSLLVKNGTVIDGSGAARQKADVAIAGDTIAAVAPELPDANAARVIDAAALVVAPGFIDIHSHSDFFYAQCPSAESKIRQGVTTEVVGMCSFSPAPCVPESRRQVEAAAHSLGAKLEVRWSTFQQYLTALEELHPSVNVVHFVGHGPIRYAAMGAENRAPTRAELETMKSLLAEAIDAGAFGLSSGLIYPPSAFAGTDELIALCASMAARGGQYFTHMRGEAETLLEAIAEAIEISEQAGVGLQIAHLKSQGRENWHLFDRALEQIEEARRRGVPASADVYPYAASSTFMTAMLPEWVHDGGIEKLLQRISDSATRQRIIAENTRSGDAWGTTHGAIGWDEIMIATCPEAAVEGLTLAALAARRGQPPAEAMLDLLVAHDAAVSVVLFTQAEHNVQKSLRQPYVMIGSDSLGLSGGEGPHPGHPHPRMYGTFPRVLARYAREARLFSLEGAIAKMTGMPAEKLGLRARGLLRPGYFADLSLFDPATVSDQATFEDPHRYPRGIPYVIINGNVVLDAGGLKQSSAGRILRH
ncbi:MAG TPA: D-aminoacylase [Xanthobacteraceae bacterium]|nr:D-aminoacylase [Xanthobacteraceae bacterium]